MTGLFLIACLFTIQSARTLDEKPSESAVFIESWQVFDEQLAECWQQDLKSVLDFQCSPSLQQAIKERNYGFIASMTAQSDHPIVAVSGCLAMREFDVDSARVAAFFVYAESSRPLNNAYQPLEALLSEKNPATAKLTLQILDECMHRYRSSAPKHLIIAFDMLNVKAVKEWLIRDENQNSSLIVARALDLVFSKNEKLTKPESEKLDNILQSLRSIPGVPRVVYVLHANPANDLYFDKVIISLLEDESLDNTTILAVISKRKRFISENIKIREVKCGSERRKLVKRILKIDE